ncbi:hypothetical protein CsSME_00008414 [Camellia sinensis var. sinensis]
MAIHIPIYPIVSYFNNGKIFETTTTTLTNGGCNSFFAAMLDNIWNLQTHNSVANDDGDYFIDWNPDCFVVLLDLLRTKELYIPSNITENLFHREALFYGLLNNVCVGIRDPTQVPKIIRSRKTTHTQRRHNI